MSPSPIAVESNPSVGRAARAGSPPRLRVPLRSLPWLPMPWQARHEQRAALAALADRLLADVGLSREQARREARRLPWR